MHIEDLLFSVNGKIIAERNSNLASCTCTRAWYCRYLLGAALNYISHGLTADERTQVTSTVSIVSRWDFLLRLLKAS